MRVVPGSGDGRDRRDHRRDDGLVQSVGWRGKREIERKIYTYI